MHKFDTTRAFLCNTTLPQNTYDNVFYSKDLMVHRIFGILTKRNRCTTAVKRIMECQNIPVLV